MKKRIRKKIEKYRRLYEENIDLPLGDISQSRYYRNLFARFPAYRAVRLPVTSKRWFCDETVAACKQHHLRFYAYRTEFGDEDSKECLLVVRPCQRRLCQSIHSASYNNLAYM